MAVNYTEFKKTCVNGYPQYYGGVLDPVTGQTTWTELNGDAWISAGQSQGYESLSLGCPPRYLTTQPNSQVYSRKAPPVNYRMGRSLTAYNNAIFRKLNVPTDLQSKLKQLEPYRSMLLMEIRNAGGHVADPSNMLEIVTEYGRLHNNLPTPPTEGRRGVNGAMVPKSGGGGGGGVDFSGIFGMLSGLVGGIIDGVNSGNVQQFLQNWATQFQTYMTTDFNAIVATLNATREAPGPWGGWGAVGALDMLLRYKNTSWQDLKNTITNYCASKQIDVPQAVKNLWTAQAEKEAELRALIQQQGVSSSGGQNVPPYASMAQISAPVAVGHGGGGYSGVVMDWGKWMPWIIGGFVVIVLLIVGLVALSKRKKGKKAAAA